jgi:hypothetical protein
MERTHFTVSIPLPTEGMARLGTTKKDAGERPRSRKYSFEKVIIN